MFAKNFIIIPFKPYNAFLEQKNATLPQCDQLK